MPDPIQSKILSHLSSGQYRPLPPHKLARDLELADESNYHGFRDALRELMHAGRVVLGASGAVVLPEERPRNDEFIGSYRHNRRGFGFVIPRDPTAKEDLFIPEGQNAGAITGDIVRAKITSRGQRDGKALYTGRIDEVIERTQKRFVGTLVREGGEWMVLPDGNALTEAIRSPDAASRHIKPGTKVVIELTSYPGESSQRPAGVITEVLGKAGEKDVDLKSVIVQFNLPGEFPEEVKTQARQAIDTFDPEEQKQHRLDITDQIVVTIDPDDAKDYDDAISLRQLPNGNVQLGVHIADVSYFVRKGTPLDDEAVARGNSAYFPGYVIPMLPEILSNGVCSLQEAVPRFCKSVFIEYDEDARPIGTKFSNTIIHSNKRLRYREAQAILDNAAVVPHPQGDRKIGDYEPEVLELLHDLDALARRLQKRRNAQGQIVLELPETELVLDEEGKVIDAVPEDTSFTHTLIEMFMVEANEAVARLLDSMELPFIRRIHPEPAMDTGERLRAFVQVAGFKLPKQIDRHGLQALLSSVRGKPESFAINLAVLKSLTRAEYSPEPVGHYALASEQYCHFTSPIRRYADLTVHRLLDSFFEAREIAGAAGGKKRRKVQIDPDSIPSYDDLVELGRHLSFTERRADDAERELRQVKLLELLKDHIGDEFTGVITGITNFGIFVQLQNYLIDGLIRYEELMDDWWDVDARAGSVRGQRTGTIIRIGDVAKVYVVKVDPPRRELNLAISQLLGRSNRAATPIPASKKGKPTKGKQPKHAGLHGGGPRAQGARRPHAAGGKPHPGRGKKSRRR